MRVQMNTSNLYSTRKQRGGIGALAASAVALFLILARILVSFPFVWMIRSSFMLETEAMRFPPLWLPSRLTVEHYFDALTIQPFGRYILNKPLYCGACGLWAIAHGFRWGRPPRRLFGFPRPTNCSCSIWQPCMVPGQVTLIPVYVMISKVGWVDNYLALIVPSLFSVYLTFLLRQFFLLIPSELEDAARIDGAGYFRTYRTIFLPLSQPALATCALLAFMGSWTNFLWPLIVIRSKNCARFPSVWPPSNSRWAIPTFRNSWPAR